MSDRHIAILSQGIVAHDGRLRKHARALANANYRVTVVGRRALDGQEPNEPFEVVYLQQDRPDFMWPWWGRPSVWRPVRGVVNRTYTQVRLDFHWRALITSSELTDIGYALKPDVVVASDLYALKSAGLVSQRLDVPLVFDSYEFFEGYFDNHYAQREANRLLKKWVPRASALLSPCPLKPLGNLYARARREIVIANSAPWEEVTPTALHEPIRLLSQSGIRRASGELLMVQAMQYLRDKATLTVQGRSVDPAYLAEIEDTIARHGLEDVVTLTGAFDPSEGVRCANAFDIGTVTRPSPLSRNNDIARPNRFYNYLNAGLACAVGNTTGFRTFSGMDEFGILLDTTSPETIARDLRPLLENPEQIAHMKYRAKELYRPHTWEEQERKLLALYAEMFASESASAA
ncbi:MAG: glycosyltransferase [Coriobacteriia bacterium]|nr:glycosyltransferase [Coriobacteriia bacterium]